MGANVQPPDLDGVAEHMRRWRHTHPRATLTEIERELDGHLAAVRAALLATVATTAVDELGVCPDCGGRLVRRGERERSVRTSGDEPLTLCRPYATCSRCGRGLFPPG